MAYQTRFEVYVWAPTRPAAERPRRRPISKSKIKWPCFEWLLTVVNTGGSVRAWRAEQARELLFLKRLVVRNRNRKRPRAELTMTHRLFLLRDDALFLRCLEYCWFLDPWKRYPSETDYRRAFGAADTEPES